MKTRLRLHGNCRWISTLEFIVVLPTLLLVLLAGVEASRMLATFNVVGSAAREGARVGAVTNPFSPAPANARMNTVLAAANIRLRSLAARNLSGRVCFVGQFPWEEMSRFYSARDIFVFPGIRESLGMVYLEAQSCGLPVVAFADGGVPEVVADGTSGYLVRPFDGAAFGAAISRLLGDSNLRRTMGREAGYYVRWRHDLDHNYRVIESTLRRLTLRKRDV